MSDEKVQSPQKDVDPKFANLANFENRLRAAEVAEGLGENTVNLAVHRTLLFNALTDYRINRFALGEALKTYRDHFLEDRNWVRAARTIASEVGVSTRTLYRILEQVELAKKLPTLVAEALEARHIVAASAKAAPLLHKLLEKPSPETRVQADEFVNEVLTAKPAIKKQVRAELVSGLDEFANRILKQFEVRHRQIDPEKRDGEIRYVFEIVLSRLGIPVVAQPGIKRNRSKQRDENQESLFASSNVIAMNDARQSA